MLANDLDPNGQPLAIVHVDSPTARGGTAMVDDGGTPGVPGDDKILYTPAAGSLRRDNFDYVVSDGTFLDTATVSVTVGPATTGVSDPPALRGVALGVHPNPVRDAVEIDFQLKRPASVELAVFSTQGRRVTTVTSGQLAGDTYSLRWNGRTADGRRLPSGVYMVRLLIDGQAITRRLVLMR